MFSIKMWLVKNSTWIRKYESQVIKSNPDTLFIFNFCHELIGKQNFSGIFFEAISLLPLKLISSWSYSHPLSYFLKIDLTLTYQKIVDICYSYLKIMYSVLTFTSILIILHIIIIPRKKTQHTQLLCFTLIFIVVSRILPFLSIIKRSRTISIHPTLPLITTIRDMPSLRGYNTCLRQFEFTLYRIEFTIGSSLCVN